jgi:ankyrin repeat protein
MSRLRGKRELRNVQGTLKLVMKQLLLAAALIIASSVAFAGPASILLDPDKVRSMSAEEYSAAVRSAPDVNARNENGVTPLHIAAGYGTPDKIAALVTAGADVEALDMDGWTPLNSAVAVGTPDKIAALVTAGADVEARNKNGMTPLHIAAGLGIPDTIAALLEAGASGSVKDKLGKTAFYYAESNDKVKGTAAYWALKDAQYE